MGNWLRRLPFAGTGLTMAALGVAACSGGGSASNPQIRDPENPVCGDPGRVALHRLNRTEYDRTVRDLLKVDATPAAEFPSDDQAHGFDNQAEFLTVAPILVEKYAGAAEELATLALEPGSASRAALVPCDPGGGEACAQEVLEALAPKAYRRPVEAREIDDLLELYRIAIAEGEGFDQGLSLALQGVLLSPSFLFRAEENHPGTTQLAGHELASRLSYFLWSSMPDQRLLDLAASGALADPATLEAEVERMLADPRAGALVGSFGEQWLQTRSLEFAQPDVTVFPDFDEELRAAMREETRRLFADHLKPGKNLLDLMVTNYTFLNERLARHYDVPGVSGPEFRRVELDDGIRGGILTHGSILTLTSNPTRTSPVKRGKWVLGQLLCQEPPPPPPGVEGLPPEPSGDMSVREQMEAHRTSPTCASCHRVMDPIGFGLESFDATGAYRTVDEIGKPIDDSGELPGGEVFAGGIELSGVLLADPNLVSCIAEQTFVFALGRGARDEDECALEEIEERFAAGGYTFEALAKAIVLSEPFRLRKGEE